MEFSLGLSPCPNDTYIFYGLLHQSIDTLGLSFRPHFADVAELNSMAYQKKLDVTKISYNAFLDLTDSHVLLNAGGALGRSCGPLLIAAEPLAAEDLKAKRIAIPGEKTTANFLLDYYLPEDLQKVTMRFDQIEDAILSKKVDAGVIIHENRFTYSQRGLVAIQDLGLHWEKSTGCPIPLGGIIAKRSIDLNVLRTVDRLIAASLTYAHDHRAEVLPFVRQYAQEMEESVIWQHIDLYVNEFSQDLGSDGRKAIDQLFTVAQQRKRIKAYRSPFL